jgi:hypothetical protein
MIAVTDGDLGEPSHVPGERNAWWFGPVVINNHEQAQPGQIGRLERHNREVAKTT